MLNKAVKGQIIVLGIFASNFLAGLRSQLALCVSKVIRDRKR
jgi:hypothetical protein